MKKIRKKGLKHAKQKGSRFERKMADLLSKVFNCDVIRTPMSGAFGTQARLPDFQGDLYCKTKDSVLKNFFFECKYTENVTFCDLHKWYDKCTLQNNGNETVIFMRDNTHDCILVAMTPECLYKWVANGRMQTKIGYKHVNKKNSNFWKEYNKVSYITKIPVVVLNNIALLEYSHWVHIIKRSIN